jgi:hypothetical protein
VAKALFTSKLRRGFFGEADFNKAPTWLKISHTNPFSVAGVESGSRETGLGHVFSGGSGFAMDRGAYRFGSKVFSASTATGLTVTPTQTSLWARK